MNVHKRRNHRPNRKKQLKKKPVVQNIVSEKFSFLEKKNKICILLTHIYTGDNITNYAMICEYAKHYQDVYIFCLYRNQYTIQQMFEPFSNIHVFVIEDPHYNYPLSNDHHLNHLISTLQGKDIDIIRTGHHNKIRCGEYFWNEFYIHANLPYEIRYHPDYQKINRNMEKEEEFYQQVKKIYGNEYIFMIDHRSISYQHNSNRDNVYIQSSYPIFHPNINFYENNKDSPFYLFWKNDFCKNNLFDYGMIIENAKEIYSNDSAFSCLMPYLDLSKVEKKVIYTFHNYPAYHTSFQDWEILPLGSQKYNQ